jgi:hypothetical protein
MKINQDNYEQYFLDHAEGNLSPEMEKELEDFLQANPDLRALLDDFDPSPQPLIEMQNEALKRRLKKSITPTLNIDENNSEEWMIRQLEGLLDEMEENELAKFISLNPAYAYDQEKFRQAKLVPDLSVTFTRKEQLKKKGAVAPILRLAWLVPAAAALVLIFIGIRYLQQPAEIISNPVEEAVAAIPVPEQETVSPEPSPQQLAASASSNDVKTIINESIPGDPVLAGNYPKASSFRMEPASVKAVSIIETADIEPGISLVAYNLSPVSFKEQKERPLFAKVFNNMVDQAKESILNQPVIENIEKSDFSLWTLAKAGVSGYNSITDRDLELYVHRDEEGKVTSYALIEEDRLLMEKNLGKD